LHHIRRYFHVSHPTFCGKVHSFFDSQPRPHHFLSLYLSLSLSTRRLSLLDILTPFYRRLVNTYSIDDPHDTLGAVDDHYLFYGLTFTYYFLCLYFALEIPDIKVVLGLMGGTVVVVMMLFLPGSYLPSQNKNPFLLRSFFEGLLMLKIASESHSHGLRSHVRIAGVLTISFAIVVLVISVFV
jgi:hypothetical protein